MYDKKILFLTNIPSPYRVDFFNELGKYCDLTVTFEGASATDRDTQWKADRIKHFKAIFLKGIRTRSDAFLCLDIMPILRKKWDHIIICGYSTPTDMLAIEYLRLHKRRFFLEADGGMIANDSPLKYAVKRHFIGAASAWFSTGKMTTDYFTHYGAVKEKCYEYPFTSLLQKDIENGVCGCSDKEAAKAILNILERRMVLSVGRFIHSKGFDVLLNAAAQLPKDTGIYIIGGEAPQDYITLRESLGLTNVHFVGFKTKQELAQYYRAADLFVLPTRSDVWGLVVNEAMSFGLPVITTDKCVAGLELIRDGENGFIVPVDDAQVLGQRMCEMITNDSMRSAMAQAALVKIQTYTIENMAKEHMRILCHKGQNV